MPPRTSREFLQAAAARLTAAEALLRARFTLDAQYLGGYAVECALKPLIVELTSEVDRPELLKKLTAGAKLHRPEILLGVLQEKWGVLLPPPIAKRLKNLAWATDFRYETGRKDTGETIACLRTAKLVHDWVEAQLS